jgi:hypothetical protein
MLQAGKLPVRDPDEVDFFNLPNPSSHTMVLGSNQPLTEMSTRNFPEVKKRSARRADNLAAICEPNVCKLWEPQSLTTLRATTACTVIALPYCESEHSPLCIRCTELRMLGFPFRRPFPRPKGLHHTWCSVKGIFKCCPFA